jgi:hypothetical protein
VQGPSDGTVVSDNVLLRNRAFTHGSTGTMNYGAQGGGDTFGYGSFSASNERHDA